MKKLSMKAKEDEQVKIFLKFEKKLINQIEAAQILKITPRWFRTKYKLFMQNPDKGIGHKNRGKTRFNKINEEVKALILKQLKGLWHDFGPTLIAEHLAFDFNIKISKESVRQILIKEGLRKTKTKKAVYRIRRERKVQFGMLVQLDGSPHNWFEDRGEKCTLLVFIDDATSNILWLEFSKTESMKGVMQATIHNFDKHGIPEIIYTDRGVVFCVNTGKDRRKRKTPWQKAVESLGAEVIHAGSPQAKGRVERCNQTLQDRLVKKMRLANISSIEEGNIFVQHSGFIEQHNKKYGVKASLEGNYHKPANQYNLYEVFSKSAYRVLNHDFTISFNKKIFQLHRSQKISIKPKDKIEIRINFHEKIKLYFEDILLNFTQIFGE